MCADPNWKQCSDEQMSVCGEHGLDPLKVVERVSKQLRKGADIGGRFRHDALSSPQWLQIGWNGWNWRGEEATESVHGEREVGWWKSRCFGHAVSRRAKLRLPPSLILLPF